MHLPVARIFKKKKKKKKTAWRNLNIRPLSWQSGQTPKLTLAFVSLNIVWMLSLKVKGPIKLKDSFKASRSSDNCLKRFYRSLFFCQSLCAGKKSRFQSSYNRCLLSPIPQQASQPPTHPRYNSSNMSGTHWGMRHAQLRFSLENIWKFRLAPFTNTINKNIRWWRGSPTGVLWQT